MIHLSPSSSPVQDTRCPPPSLPVEALRQQVQSLDPDLHTDSPTFSAAVLLLAAAEIGQNVDRLARYTGLRRDFVARCARRLCDNGVWRNGNIIHAWTGGGDDATAFWKDVQVAEGKLCRRRDDQGQIEWAPAGYWTKSYDYIVRQSESEGCLYLSPVIEASYADAPVSLPSAFDEHRPGKQKRRLSDPTGSSRRPSPEHAVHRATGLAAESVPNRPQHQALPPGTELFPDAVWLM